MKLRTVADARLWPPGTRSALHPAQSKQSLSGETGFSPESRWMDSLGRFVIEKRIGRAEQHVEPLHKEYEVAG